MTAFTSAMLPTGARAISTFEELSAWSAAVVATANPANRFKRFAEQSSELSASFGNYADSEGIYRSQSVVISQLDTTKIGLGLADWKKVKEISTTAASSLLIG